VGEVVNQRENVVVTLKHSSPSWLPRGELFFTRKFLDVYFPDSQGDYTEQTASAACLLGLSVVGVDLNEEWSRSLLRQGNYGRLRDYFTVGYINGPVAQAIMQRGFRQAMICIKKDRRTLSDIVSGALKDFEETCGLAGKNGLSAIALADDIAGSKGLLLSPGDFADVVLPYYRQIAQIIKSNDLYAFFHSDGDTRTIIEPLIGAGYDCIHPVDAQAGLDLYDLKKTFGNRVSFMGHIDIINRDEGQIAQEVKHVEDVFKEGGLILGSTCGLSMETISDRLHALYPQWEGAKQGQ
jgi:uroporphyrinogen-III decarboxylase